MNSMAQAWHRDSVAMVDVVSVYGGEWLIQNLRTGEVQVLTSMDGLVGMWVNAEIVDTFDEFVSAFGIADSFFMVAAIAKNSEWAQVIAQQWAHLY